MMRAQIWQTAPGRWNYDLGVGRWADSEGFRVIVDGQRHYLTRYDALAAACDHLRGLAELKVRR